MKSGRILLFLMLSLFLLISACRDDNNKNDYSGVGEMIAERNKARYEVAENPPAAQTGPARTTAQKSSTEIDKSRNDELASAILYEQNVKIVGTDSGRTLADGVAYINKKGQIVRIKILKE